MQLPWLNALAEHCRGRWEASLWVLGHPKGSALYSHKWKGYWEEGKNQGCRQWCESPLAEEGELTMLTLSVNSHTG